MKISRSRFFRVAAVATLLGFAGCRPPTSQETGWIPGYLEADGMEITSSESGYLTALNVSRGQKVVAGTTLFALDATPISKELEAARARRKAAEQRAADAALGEREETLRRMTADLEAAREALRLARLEQARQETLLKEAVSTQAQFDLADSAVRQQQEHVHSLEATLDLARQGQRPLLVEALRADAEAFRAMEAHLQWRLDQTTQKAPADAIVEDVLREPGEWVPAARPVVLLRRIADLRVRCFLSPAQIATLRLGDRIEVRLPGESPLLHAPISRIADRAEYTPPVIYSREESERLVVMVEADLPPADAERLHPGLPVTIRLPSFAP